MRTVQSLSEKDLPNKYVFIASLHSCIGNAQLELGEGEMALKHHLDDLGIAEERYRTLLHVCLYYRKNESDSIFFII